MRLPPALVLVLAVVLVLVAGLADRALVGRADALREAALLRIDEDAQLAVQSLQAALGQVEQSVVAGQAPQGVACERLALPPPRSLSSSGFVPYGERTRAELARLLASDRATPNGLPEAVVARLVLGPEAPVSGAASTRSVEERLLDGALPVRPEDLPYLARRLGVGEDARVRSLHDRLLDAPAAAGLPAAPAFHRRLTEASHVAGWTRVGGRWLTRYELAEAVLLERAGIADRAEAITVAGPPPAAEPGLARVVAVPDIPGLRLRVRPRLPGSLRLAALRGVLWLSALAGIVGLFVLRRALAREARAVARERAFLAGVTHEFRSPLASIRVLGETLARGRGEPREYGALVAQEGQRLEGLVERVLTLTRVEQVLRPGPVDPAELLREVMTLVRSRAERRNSRVECRVDDPLPECWWDAEAVRRALLNLVDNAISHGREGERVQVSADSDGSEVRLCVADDGPGIAGTERRRIFGRFERGSTEAPGTGLGLFLVEEVARAHGGRVDLETAEGQGSTFTLVLPLRAPEAPAAE
ncbi:MAG: HAMP domain-containing sensor histidine kinase [Acidobacteriota bacterium]|jgi:signal transduction histidine kinase